MDAEDMNMEMEMEEMDNLVLTDLLLCDDRFDFLLCDDDEEYDDEGDLSRSRLPRDLDVSSGD